MSALIFVRDGRTLPYLPVTIAALDAIRATCETPREAGERRSYPHAIAVYMALLELANEARADRVAITQRDLGEKAMASRSAVQSTLSDLQAAGVVEKREQAHGRARIENEYVVVEPAPARETEVQENAPSPFSDAGVASEKSSSAGARPSHPSDARADVVKREKKNAHARAVTYEGRPVDPAVVDDARVLLDLFNSESDRRLSAVKASGQPSDHLRQVIGALLANPDATLDDWEQGVRRVVACPPSWVDGRALGLGDVFGGRAAAHTLAPPPAARSSNGQPVVPRDGPMSTGEILTMLEQRKAAQRSSHLRLAEGLG